MMDLLLRLVCHIMVITGTIKDVIPRYKTMQGYRVERRFGWDCHGLPVEYEIEQTLGLKGRPDIEEFGVGNLTRNAERLYSAMQVSGEKP